MASSSRSSPSTPAFSPRSWTNHVFLNFRGEDIRMDFLGHLYNALIDSSIATYMDDKKLSLGDSIEKSLIKSIKESQIAVTIFSKNYANSSWCLNELVCIMKCKKKRGLIVVPIFYDVEPSEVRKQTGKYGDAFAKHESEKDAKLVSSWRRALKKAGGISGQHFNKKAEINESKLIKKVVHQIRKVIQPLTPGPVDDNLVGMEDRMDELISKFQIGSDYGVIMIGIWGVGGGGKTTLANSVYHKVRGEFYGCCCIDNVRDQSSKIGLEALQGKILSGVLKNEEMRAGSMGEGKYMIRNMLSNKKVLIVLDDVDHLDQLEALAGSLNWFGDGSRIIITTRDEHLLTAHRVEVHKVRLLNEEEARKLFRKRARLENKPMEEDYTKLSEAVFTYASGLPLALKVLGSSLVGRGMKEWKGTLDSLKTIPREDIVGQLKISYEGLTKVQKDLFLDIACFFRRYYEDDAMEILEACGFNPDIEVNVLREKALITISNGRFDMHDRVQEMGHHIVRGEGAYHNEPERYSRVWKKEDALRICSMDATTNVDMIEAIRLDTDYGVDFYRIFEGLPPLVANTKNLRWIEWKGDLAGPLLTKFPPTKLCYLKLSYNHQDKLWEGYKNLPYLKILVLNLMPRLIQTPNFHGIRNLKRLKLSYCEYLKEIDSSIGSLEKLDCLSIENCSRLTMFPSISRLKNLETLSLGGCKSMFFLSEIQQNSGGTEVQNPGEDLVDVYKCDFVPCYLAHYNRKHIPLRVSSSLQQLTGLRKLNLGYCNLGNGNIGSDIWELPNLQELDLVANNFSCLDFSRFRLPQLKLLDVTDCENLVSLSNLPSSIAVIEAGGCSLLKTFGEISDCKWLWKVTLIRSNNFNKKAEINESKLIKKVVNQIRKMIHPLTPGPVDDNLVGMEDRMDELISKFQIGSDYGVIMIGIWGVGGGGKTTLANSVYHKVRGEFDGCCCIENIRENSSKVGVGLHKLQGNILSGVLKKEMNVGSIVDGKYMIRDMLSNKKVLIVLDDVDHLDQLEALAGSLNWFGDGSRIIITTRDEHLLTAHRVEVHEVSLLNKEEARKLFCKRAGLEHKPMDDYTELSEQVLTYASGLPLALNILGSSLVGRGMKEWISALKSLKVIPLDDIMGQLKISYEGLTKVQKDLFLDIACFFRRYYEDDAMEILEACGFNPDIEVNVLREKALITISNGMFDMHDLVQEMGHHIVRGEGAYHNEPEKHSRVWKMEDVLTICSMDATTNVDMIEAIRLDTDFYRIFEGLPPVFANTKNLRWIKWRGDLAGPLLTKFPPTKLCYLKLSGNCQEQLWEGYKNLPNLKILVLKYMLKLIQTPNFHGIRNLKRFKLYCCEYLKEIDSSIGSLENLDFLSIEYCSRLMMFPSISRLKNLETLSLEGCKSMFFLSEIQQNSGGTEVQNPGEDLVDVYKCDFVPCSLAHYNRKHIPLRVSSSLQQLTGLRKLNLGYCNLGNGNIGSDIWELPNLQELDLYGNKFSCLDFSRFRLPQLKLLDVTHCGNLVSLSNLPSSIAVIEAGYCSLLKTFGEISDCKWLWKVTLKGSYNLDPCDCEKLLLDMLKGNAIEDYFISVMLPHQIPVGLKDMFFKGKSFTKHTPYGGSMMPETIYTLRLPDNWYNEFCGFFMRVVAPNSISIEVSIKQGPYGEGSQFEMWQESYEAPEHQYDEQMETYVGYVSFGSLRSITSLNSSFNIISFSIENNYCLFAAELVPMNHKYDLVQTTDCSDYWDGHKESFRIFENDSKSCIDISWDHFIPFFLNLSP